MCATCGCDEHHHHDHHHDHEPRRERIERDLLAKNAEIAAANRSRLQAADVAVINLIGAPGAGKTSLLEATIRRLPDLHLAVVEGDQETDRDARRIERVGGKAHQVNTGPGCHLDAQMVAQGLGVLSPARGSIVFVENVGNLVCPALFDLGERSKVVVMSVAEGDDKPLKYPHVFRAASHFVMTKTDLLEHVDFSPDACIRNARAVNPRIQVMPVSARSGAGMDAWCAWVRDQLARA